MQPTAMGEIIEVLNKIHRRIARSFYLLAIPLLAVLPGEPGSNPGGSGSGGSSISGKTQPIPPGDVSQVSDISDLIGNVATGLATILFALAAVFIIIAGIFYLTAAGNQTQLDKAKNTLIYAIVGVVLGLIAFGVAALVRDFLVSG